MLCKDVVLSSLHPAFCTLHVQYNIFQGTSNRECCLMYAGWFKLSHTRQKIMLKRHMQQQT